MKKLIVIAGAIGIVIFQSCGSDKKTESESETVATEQPTVQRNLLLVLFR